MNTETDDEIRLRRAKAFLAECRELENSTRMELAERVATTRRAKEKFEALFHETEARAVALRSSAA